MIKIKALWITFLLIAAALSADSTDELVGLWKAKRRFGPDARGLLVIQRTDAKYSAEIVGRTVPVAIEKGELSFDLPNGEGSFRGRLQDGGDIAGHWYPPNGMGQNAGGKFVSPVRLKPNGPNRWSGQVVPFEDTFTFYLLARKRPDGTIGVFLRNPERDFGAWLGVDRIVREGNVVKLIGKRPGQTEEGEAASGTYDAENEVITLSFPFRGGSYDFRRDGDDSDFYPRGKNPARYEYRPPLARDDGWPTGSLNEVGIDRAGIEKLIQRILDMPMESVDTPEIHGVLIARHGKLVLEEYFHGQHRDKLHETRSAAKSVTATLVGAAMQTGAPLALSTPVYKAMNGGEFPADLDPRKRAMTLEHLLTMSSGYFCDDTNPEAPGGEEIMINQEEEPDYYRFTLKVPMASAPGEKAVYCSSNPNLALGVLGRATSEFPLDTFDRLLGAPMKIDRYGWPIDPAGNPYGGGGVQLLPRDFMKFGQLMLNGGTWEGRRILSRDFVARASASLYHLRNVTYGYLWWGIDYPYKNRTVHAFYATGAGGQTVTVVPDLDLVVATFAGNFSSKGSAEASLLTPRYILPAVREPGDDPNAPVVPREDYLSPYGRSEISGPVSPPQ
ncbi:MAG TPA: serine hydrolase [Thermoanaerobaculia bacterium]|jgi:CubicO group peptidase (beta-lactamase class C family)|nr:serine hydrolase [Thermoanaerobaculia bacterium]